MTDIDCIVCLGKIIYQNGDLDSILKGRVEKALNLFKEKPTAAIIFSGGLNSSNTKLSEAKAMLNYAKTFRHFSTSNVILEEEGETTIHQLCTIKTKYLIPNNWNKIALVTDEIHMRRALLTFQHILGNGFELITFPSKVDLVGKWRSLIEQYEQELYQLTLDTRVDKITSGDHESWLREDIQFRANRSSK